MKDFVEHLADDIWPQGKRYGNDVLDLRALGSNFVVGVVFCYSAQFNEQSEKQSCHAKEGNPFGPYWSHFNIDFDRDIFYKPLFFDIRVPDGWNAQ